jgi:hypothetical protein
MAHRGNRVGVKLVIKDRAQVCLKAPNESRLPRPTINLAALPQLQKLENVVEKVMSPTWWNAWFNYLSEDQKDGNNIRDLILSKLPIAKLYAVGCVPMYKKAMFNISLNPILQRHLSHCKEYFLSSFCIIEKDLKVGKPSQANQQLGVDLIKEEFDKEQDVSKHKKLSLKVQDVKELIKGKNESSPNEPLEHTYIILPTEDESLEGVVNLEDQHIQIELIQGENQVRFGLFKVRGENDNYSGLVKQPYVQLELITKNDDLEFGCAILTFRVVNVNDLFRQIHAYHIASKKWVVMPSLNFLPPKVNGMLAGEGGLLLLFGDIIPYEDPMAIKPKPLEINVDDGNKLIDESKHVDGEKPIYKKSIKKNLGKDDIKPSLKPKPKKKISLQIDKSLEEGVEGVDNEEKPNDDKLLKNKKKIVDEEKKPKVKVIVEFPPQHLLIICNPIARTFRILPPMHCNLENMVARLVVNPMSNSYVAYIVGFHRRIRECLDPEGMRLAIYKSTHQIWRIFNLPACKLFRPGQSNYSRALPLVTKLFEGPTLFLGAEVMTQKTGVYAPVILSYRLCTRTWKAYEWPSASVTEFPQVVECNNELYIVARGVVEPLTMNIWKFIPHAYDIPSCQLVTMMPPTLFASCFTKQYRKSEFDCVSSMECISFISRENAISIVSYNVKTNKWMDPPFLRYPGFSKGQTFLGNWHYEPSPYAQV